jgi:hypothetical protein
MEITQLLNVSNKKKMKDLEKNLEKRISVQIKIKLHLLLLLSCFVICPTNVGTIAATEFWPSLSCQFKKN